MSSSSLMASSGPSTYSLSRAVTTSNFSSAANSNREQLVKNLRAMKTPTNLLKFGANGRPKFKNFQLSEDNQYLLWDSKNKTAEQTRVKLTDIREVRFGQRTEKFFKANRKDLQHLSFSIIYGAKGIMKTVTNSLSAEGETLDLVCKDEKEFQTWADTLLAVVQGKIDLDMWAQVDQAPVATPASPTSKDIKTLPQSPSNNEPPETNDVYTFGWSEWGQNGTGNDLNNMYATPQLIKSLLGKGVIQIACGWSHTVLLLENGTIVQCGNRLGTGLAEDFFNPTPTPIPDKPNITSISCGAFHSLAVSEQGEVFSWGCSFNGQLGHGDTKDAKVPKLVEGLRGVFIVKTACGEQGSAALAQDGTVYTWGSGAHGFLGHGDTKSRLTPTAIQFLVGTDIVKIAAGGYSMFACTDRETWSWGYNASGQLGLGHDEDQLRPHTMDAMRGNRVKDIACGAAHVLCLAFVPKPFGQTILFAWGSNASGQLGQEKKVNFPKPTPVTTLENANLEITNVACGDVHSCFLTSDGTIYACGNNAYGQLGLGEKNAMRDVTEFHLVSTLKEKEVRAVVCGGQNTAVLTARVWIDDKEAKECMKCHSAFTFVNRKHHCRNCGGIFCANCSNKKIAILRLGTTEPLRVCEKCYTTLGGR